MKKVFYSVRKLKVFDLGSRRLVRIKVDTKEETAFNSQKIISLNQVISFFNYLVLSPKINEITLIVLFACGLRLQIYHGFFIQRYERISKARIPIIIFSKCLRSGSISRPNYKVKSAQICTLQLLRH